MRPSPVRIALAALVILGAAAPLTAQVGRVSGLVRDDSGQPIKGATVMAENANIGPATFTATTDDKGRFTIIGLRAGPWRFVAVAPGHTADAAELAVRFGSPNPPLAFALRRNGPGIDAPLGAISGRDLQSALAAADNLFREQRWDEAIAAYRAIMTRTPALSIINLQVAEAYRGKGDLDGALASYQALLSADPGSEKAKIGVSSVHVARGDLDAAEAALAPAAQAGAGRDLLFALAEVKLARGDRQEAARWFEQAAAADASWGKPLYQLGVLAMERGEAQAAASFMDRVVAVDPTSPEAVMARTALTELNR